MQDYSTLASSELCEQMKVAIEFKKEHISDVGKASRGQYQPIEHYREVLKYSEEVIARIVAKAPSKEDDILGKCYKVDVTEDFTVTTDRVSSSATWAPKPAAQPPSSSAGHDGGGQLPSSSGHGGNQPPGDGARGSKVPLRRSLSRNSSPRKQKSKRDRDELGSKGPLRKKKVNYTILAKKITGMVTPLAETLQHQINKRVHAKFLKDCVPEYMVRQAKHYSSIFVLLFEFYLYFKKSIIIIILCV